MKIEIVRNVKVIDGELYFDDSEEYETDNCSFTLIRDSKEKSLIGLLTIGFALTGKQIEISKFDVVHIKEIKK